jgi:hypothetical protein
MSQTLDEFLEESRNELIKFESDWRKKNSENPEMYPMEMRDGNEGLWWEFLQMSGSDE